MARIAGVNLPNQKRLEIGLTYIYGIGQSTAQKVCAELGLVPDDEGQATSPTRRSRSSATTSTRTSRSRATCAASARRRSSACRRSALPRPPPPARPP